jgi:DNA-directed RNA polymerase subunit RPC12/RpoP
MLRCTMELDKDDPMTARPILHLKTLPASMRPPAPVVRWKCKPCGTPFEVSGELGDDQAVRCPSCNARLGRADQFRAGDAAVRARRT